MSHKRHGFAGGVHPAIIIRERLLQGSEVHLDGADNVVEEFGRAHTTHNRIRMQSLIGGLRPIMEKDGKGTLVCREGTYKFINKRNYRSERAVAKEETHLRSARVGSSFHSLGRQVSTLLSHDGRQLPFVERSLMEIEDLVRGEKRRILAKKLGTRTTNLYLPDRRVKNNRRKKS